MSTRTKDAGITLIAFALLAMIVLGQVALGLLTGILLWFWLWLCDR